MSLGGLYLFWRGLYKEGLIFGILRYAQITKIWETDWKVNKDKVIGVLILDTIFWQSTVQNQCFRVIKKLLRLHKLSKSSHFSSLKYKLALMQSSGMFWSSQLSLKNGGSQYNPNNYTEIG